MFASISLGICNQMVAYISMDMYNEMFAYSSLCADDEMPAYVSMYMNQGPTTVVAGPVYMNRGPTSTDGCLHLCRYIQEIRAYIS